MDDAKRKRKRGYPRTPRGLAVELLNRIDDTAAFAEPLLDSCLSAEVLPLPQDRGLVTELVYGTLRRKGHLDWIIGQFRQRDSSAREKTALNNILRTALYQLIYMDRIPAFAAVNEAVNLAKKVDPAKASMVNGILRNFLRRRDSLPYPDSVREAARHISIIHSHPLWLVERWIAVFGVEEAKTLCEADNRTPPLTVRVNTLKANRGEAMASLKDEGVEATPTLFSPDGLIIGKFGAPLQSLKSVQHGLIRVQDEASQLVSRLGSPRPGEDVLDLCSGSGGKAIHLAALMENRGRILAVDVSKAKIESLKDAAGRMGATIIETLPADASAPDENLQGRFDLVLVDAPCTGLGTLRRNPEIRWRTDPDAVRGAADLQGRILASAAACVKTGGRLVYSTCSVMPEENEDIIAAFLAGHNTFSLNAMPDDPAIGKFIGPDGFFRTYPYHPDLDGFFGAFLSAKK
jgi:16S rRNA (cytosine967-C5)-methyltransferase